MKKTFCTAIVLAAGSGKRMGTKIAKQYLEIDGKPLLYYTLLAFERSPQIDKIILTVGSEEQISYCQETILRPYGFQKVASVITGGKGTLRLPAAAGRSGQGNQAEAEQGQKADF